MSDSKKLQARIDEDVYGVWFDTVDIDPYSQPVRSYDHLFYKEQTFSDKDNKVIYRVVDVEE